MEILLVLVALAFPVCAIWGFVLAWGARTQIRFLAQRLAVVEAQLGAAGAAPAAAPEAQAPPEPTPFWTEEPATTEPPPIEAPRPAEAPPESPPALPPDFLPDAAAAPPAPPTSQPGFEERLGTRWAVWVGGVALGARRPLPRALFDRAGAARPGRARRRRRLLRACAHCGRRMDAPARDRLAFRRDPLGPHTRGADRSRDLNRVCDGVRGLRALRHDRHRPARSCSSARSPSRRCWPRRCMDRRLRRSGSSPRSRARSSSARPSRGSGRSCSISPSWFSPPTGSRGCASGSGSRCRPRSARCCGPGSLPPPEPTCCR